MKQLIIYTALIPLLLWSCSSNENDYLPEGQYPILLSATVEGANTNLRSTDDIGSVGVTISGGTNYNNIEFSGTGGTLTGQTQCYWQTTQSISIYAYAPYQTIESNSIGLKTDQSNTANYNEAAKLLIATGTADFANRNSDISLVFSPRLSRIAITLVPGDGITAADLANASVIISGTATTASINPTDGAISNLSNMQDITSHKPENMTYQAIVLPQTLATGTTFLSINNVGQLNNFSYKLNSTQLFEQGKQYSYKVTVSQKGITVTPVDIQRWTDVIKESGSIAKPTVTYKVGDYYPDPTATTSDGGTTWTGTRPIAVVFWLNPNDNRHGKAVGLEQVTGRWGPVRDELAEGVVDIRSWSDGKTATRNLIEKRRNEADFATNYFLFNWIYEKNNYNLDGIWYLPALNEVISISRVISTINMPLTNAGGVACFSSTYHICSTERNSYDTSIISSNGSSGLHYKSNNQAIPARCILSF